MKCIKAVGTVIFLSVANCTTMPNLNERLSSNNHNSENTEINAHKSEVTYTKLSLTTESNVKNRVENMNKFSFSLFNKIAMTPSQNNNNIVISPLSIQTAFSLVYPAASPEAVEEMAKVLKFGTNKELFHQSMHDYIESLPNSFGESKWSLANQVWVDNSITLKNDYLNKIKSYYNTGVNSLDFKNNPESARSTINTDIANKTNQLIKDLLPRGSVTKATAIILTNSIYMLANWKKPFDPSSTKNEEFTKQDGTKLSVDMMNSVNDHNYADLGDYKVLSLDYAHSEIAMLWILPKENIPLSTFQKNFNATKFSNSLLALEKKYVSLKLPKFSIQWGSESLKDWLQSLGMVRALSGDPIYYSNIFEECDNMVINDVVHKTKVIVDESGTEAAAATDIIISRTAGPKRPQPVPFFVDRPAMFFIYDKVYGGIIFMGTLEKPENL